jgi:predicted deacetylase
MKIEELKSYDTIDKRGEKANKEARKAKFRLMGPLKQLHNIIVYIKGSTAQIAH